MMKNHTVPEKKTWSCFSPGGCDPPLSLLPKLIDFDPFFDVSVLIIDGCANEGNKSHVAELIHPLFLLSI